jgi:hypothetical protein
VRLLPFATHYSIWSNNPKPQIVAGMAHHDEDELMYRIAPRRRRAWHSHHDWERIRGHAAGQGCDHHDTER